MLQPLKSSIERLFQIDVPVLAGGLAFYGVLSVFPSLALALLIYGFIASQLEVLAFAEATKHLLPHHAHRIVSDEFALLADWAPHHFTPGVVLGVALVAWSAMSGWKALISGIRVVSGERSHLSILGYQFQSLFLSFVFVGAIVTAILAFMIIVRILGTPIELSAPGQSIESGKLIRLEVLIWTLASLGIYMALLTIYRVAISRSKASLADCAKGAAAATLAWFLAILAFDLYAESASWRTIYGALTGMIAFLLWFYISAYTALFGAAFAASLKQQREQARPRG